MSTNSEAIVPFHLNEIDNPLIPKLDNTLRPLTIVELKQQYLHEQMLARKTEYLVEDSLSVHCVTWNINGRDIRGDANLLLPSTPADIIVLGFQEADRSAEAYMTGATGRKEVLVGNIDEALVETYGEDIQYKLVASRILVGLFIAVFCKADVAEQVSHVSTSSVACGVMGMVGNKGAVAVRLKLQNTYFCFVNCHLAAHSEQVYRRNQDMLDIHRRLQFSVTKTGSDTKFDVLPDKYLGLIKTAGVDDCDVLIWLGDFNYRVDMESKLARIFIENGQIGPVLEKDQLRLEKAKGGILQKYTEAEINFAPSYHFDVGTDRYDTSEKQRVPSWCDRIIWRQDDKVKPQAYDCVLQAKSSDHKPVTFLGTASIESVDKKRFEKVFAEILKQLDVFENETIPDTEVDSNMVSVQSVPYFQVSSASLTLRNKGKVPSQFRFVPPGGIDGPPHPNWIRLAPDHGIVMPGQALQITVFFIHDNEVARKALKPDQFMESILVLHIEGGRDHFVSVSMGCRATDFGRHLENLKYHRVVLDRRRPSDIFKVPSVLWRLVDFLMKPGAIETPNLFLLAADREVTIKLQNALDAHEAFDEATNREDAYYAAAELILRFFEALPESIVPSNLFFDCIEASTNRDKAFQVLEQMPEPNYLLFEYIIRFWRDVLLARNATVTLDAIIKIMVAIFIRKADHARISALEQRSLYSFFEHFFKT